MATPKWFDADVYMQNKLAQLKAQEPDAGWTLDRLYDAFRKGGFVGAEGQYEHFVKFGAAEEVAPNAYFNADEYYAAKAKQYYEEELKQEFTGSEEQIAYVKAKIKDADMNAWTHYQQFGSAEGVNPSNAFDASDYCAAKAEAMNKAGQKAPDGTEWTAEKIAEAIDQAGMSVLEHYLTFAGTGKGEVAAGSTYPVSEDEQVVVPNPGETVVVNDSATTYTGTAGDDTFYVTTELREYNTLDGGEGNDTLVLYDHNQRGTIKNIENLVVRLQGSSSSSASTYDLSAFSSSFTLEGGTAEVKNVTSQKLVTDNATKLTVNMAAGQASVDLASQNRAADQTFALRGDSLTSVKLAVDESDQEVNFTNSTAKVTDLTITATTSAAEDDAAKINASALTNLANVTVTGAGAVKLTVDTASAVSALKAVDATANTGGVEVDLSNTKLAKVAFTGGDGDDTLTVKGSKVAHALGAGDDTVVVSDTDLVALDKGFSVDGGKGVDTLRMTYDIAKTMTSDAFKVFTNFEELTITNEVSDDLNMAAYTGIGHLTLTKGFNAAGKSITDMQSGSTLELTANAVNDFEVSVKGATEGKADVLNIALTGDTTVDGKAITVAAVENINVVATDTDGKPDVPVAHSLSLEANAATSVTVSGDAGLKLTLTGSNKIDTIDAVGNSGGVEIVNALNDGATFTGGTGADTVTLGKSNTVFGGEGADTFKVSNTEVNELSEIKDFGVGDKISMGDFTGSLGKALVSVDSSANLANYVTLATQGAKGVAWFQYAGDTYVVGNDGKVGFDAAADFIVKLSGTDIDLSDASFTAGILSLPAGA